MSVDFQTKLFQESDFSDCETVIAAVSGGSDSTALLFLLRDHLAKIDNAPRLLAVTVDHRLRPESAAEAQKVAALCARLGIQHQTVCWADAKPQTALSHQARIARYGLLFAQAEKVGATVIMTGHTLNDQAETYQMRLHRGSRRGLACMPRESLLMRKVRLIRPLLDVKREQLREYLKSLDQDWIDDPSNDNLDYERVRVRKSLNDEDIDIIRKNIEEAATARRQQSKASAALVGKLGIVMSHALCTVRQSSVESTQHPDYFFTFSTIAAIVGGASHLATDRQVQYLQEQLEKPHDSLYRFTLLGAVIEKNGNTIRLWREARNQTASVIAPSASAIWDGRYRIDNHDKRSIRVSTPSLCDIKTSAALAGIESRNIHFPSLQTALAIFTRDGVDIPALTGKLVYAENISCHRFMRPFGWLVSSDDYPLYDALGSIFEAYIPPLKRQIRKNLNESA